MTTRIEYRNEPVWDGYKSSLLPLTSWQEFENFVEEICFFGGKTIVVNTLASGRQEGHEKTREASWNEIAAKVVIVFAGVAISFLKDEIPRRVFTFLGIGFLIAIPIAKFIFWTQSKFDIIDPSVEECAKKFMDSSREKNLRHEPIPESDINKIFEFYDNKQISEECKKFIIEKLTGIFGIIARSPTKAQYDLILQKMQERNIPVSKETKQDGRKCYERSEATALFYQNHPGLEGTGMEISGVNMEALIQGIEDMTGVGNDEIQRITKALIGEINLQLSQRATQGYPEWRTRFVTLDAHASERVDDDENDEGAELKGCIFPDYLSGLPGNLSFLYGALNRNGQYISDKQLVMGEGLVAKILQQLVDQGKIAHFYFDCISGTRCYIQA